MFCQRTKEYFSQKQIPFQERDVTKETDAVTELQRLDYLTAPVTVIYGTVIVGFDAAKIDSALGE
jgi:glutaredoxin 3